MNVLVLMSTYNGENYLREQIDSIVDQIKEKDDIKIDIDILVRDDGSKDNTIEILKGYKEKNILDYYTGENIGPAGSFVDLLFNCGRYDYYALADQDDYWLNEKVINAVSMIESEKRSVGFEKKRSVPFLYGSNAELVDANLKSLNKEFYPHIPRNDYKLVSCSCGLLGCTMVFDDNLVKIVRQHSKPHKLVMHDFYITLIAGLFDGKILYDGNSYIQYRQHGDNVCGATFSNNEKIKKHLKALIKAENISVSDQADEILEIYGDDLSDDKKLWLNRVRTYRNNFISRIELALSTQFHFYSISRGVAMRLMLLCGKL